MRALQNDLTNLKPGVGGWAWSEAGRWYPPHSPTGADSSWLPETPGAASPTRVPRVQSHQAPGGGEAPRCSKAALPERECAPGPLWVWLKCRSGLVDLGWGLRSHISRKVPGDAAAAALRTVSGDQGAGRVVVPRAPCLS